MALGSTFTKIFFFFFFRGADAPIRYLPYPEAFADVDADVDLGFPKGRQRSRMGKQTASSEDFGSTR